MGILQQNALEEHDRAVLLEFLDDRHVALLEHVTGLTPLQFFAQFKVKQDAPEHLHGFLPLSALFKIGIDLGVHALFLQ